MKSLIQKILSNTLQILLTFMLAPFLKLGKDPNIEKTMSLYSKEGFVSVFTKIRFWDAPFTEISKFVPKKGVILDLGCGDGILTNYLGLSEKSRKLIGIELNKNRVKDADRGLTNTKFIQGSVLTKKFPKADAILMTHLLHHLPSLKDQEYLIEKSANTLTRGKKLIIAEVAEKPFTKYLISWFADAVIVPILFDRQFFTTKFFYRKSSDWISLLKKNSFTVKKITSHKGKPFSHVIFVATKN